MLPHFDVKMSRSVYLARQIESDLTNAASCYTEWTSPALAVIVATAKSVSFKIFSFCCLQHLLLHILICHRLVFLNIFFATKCDISSRHYSRVCFQYGSYHAIGLHYSKCRSSAYLSTLFRADFLLEGTPSTIPAFISFPIVPLSIGKSPLHYILTFTAFTFIVKKKHIKKTIF